MIHCISPHNQKKDKNKFKNKKQPELPENQTVWVPTIKELKKKHSSRLVGKAEMGRRMERTHSKRAARGPGRQDGSWWSGWSHICMWVNQGEQLGNETDHAAQGSSIGK